jgi:toxin YoeB
VKILFSERAWEDYLYWQQTDKKMLNRVNNLINWTLDKFEAKNG